MTRSVPEWIGRTPDAPIPPRVKERVARKADDRCLHCTREVCGKLRAEFDHAIPLIMGGANRESNIQLLCHECHAAKSRRDVKIKSLVANSRLKKLGIKTSKGRPMPGSRASGFKRKMDGTVERRSTHHSFR